MAFCPMNVRSAAQKKSNLLLLTNNHPAFCMKDRALKNVG
jgi:hypothetical protein